MSKLRQIASTRGTFTGAVPLCYQLGVDTKNEDLYFKDNTGQWKKFVFDTSDVEIPDAVLFQTNDVDNGSQTLLNLIQGTNMTITEDGDGNVTFTSTGDVIVISEPEATSLATTEALPASTYDNGTLGVGATITGNGTGIIADIDGVTPTLGMKILVKDQVDLEENGVYEVTDVGDGSNPFILTRVTTSDETDELYPQGVVVANGDTNATLLFLQQTSAPVIGTDDIIYSNGIAVASLTLAPIGSTPNANAATLVGSVLNLEPASISFGGVLSPPAVDQVIGGKKTFTKATNNAFNVDGTWTASANSQRHVVISPIITTRATASDTAVGVRIAPTFILSANTQILNSLDVDPTITNGAFPNYTNVAIQVNGDIYPKTDASNNVGTVSTLGKHFNSMGANYAYMAVYNPLVPLSAIKFQNGSSVQLMELYNGVQNTTPGSYKGTTLQIATHGNFGGVANGYMVDIKGEGKFRGSLSIAALTTPTGTVANVNTAGLITYTYKIVAHLVSGGTTAASAAITTNTGFATLGANFNRISITEVVGAISYDIYRTAVGIGGSPSSTGKIGVLNAGSFSSLSFDDTGLAGDSSIPPTVNTTAQLGIGTLTPTGALDVVSTAQGSLPLPRMTKTQRDAIVSPAIGTFVYQTDNTPGPRHWNGFNWMRYTETAD